MRVPFSAARAGLGKYCSNACANEGRSNADAVIAALPATVYSIASSVGITPHAAVKTIRRMVGKGLMHPSGLELAQRRTGSEYHTLVYSAGAAPDGVPVDDLKRALLHFQQQALLAAMPGTLPQLAAATGLHVNTVSRFLKAMRGEPDAAGFYSAAHIRSWRRPHKGAHMPVYERGRGRDAVDKFVPRTRSERHQRLVAKLERLGKIGEYRARDAQRRQERRKAQRRLMDGDPLVNAIFGTPTDRRKKDRRTQ